MMPQSAGDVKQLQLLIVRVQWKRIISRVSRDGARRPTAAWRYPTHAARSSASLDRRRHIGCPRVGLLDLAARRVAAAVITETFAIAPVLSVAVGLPRLAEKAAGPAVLRATTSMMSHWVRDARVPSNA